MKVMMNLEMTKQILLEGDKGTAVLYQDDNLTVFEMIRELALEYGIDIKVRKDTYGLILTRATEKLAWYKNLYFTARRYFTYAN